MYSACQACLGQASAWLRSMLAAPAGGCGVGCADLEYARAGRCYAWAGLTCRRHQSQGAPVPAVSSDTGGKPVIGRGATSPQAVGVKM